MSTPGARTGEIEVHAAVIHGDFLVARRWRSRTVNANAHVPIDMCITNPPYRRKGRRGPGNENPLARERFAEREPVLRILRNRIA